MDTVTIVASFFPRPDAFEPVRQAIGRAQESVVREPGCLRYDLFAGADRLVLIEEWAGEDALATHNDAPALAALLADLDGLLARDVEIVRLSAVPGPTA